jgi:SAM-dependent methyltransferase
MLRRDLQGFEMTAGLVGYERDASGVWHPRERIAFSYNDGDDHETRLLAAVRALNDRSIASPELAAHIDDWVSEYHLSPVRANLLRPLESVLGGRVLEIGAGCGALTRYLGELGASVVAVEGSARRAEIAATRCRDLANVAVVCDTAERLEFTGTFDAITLVGVLGYAQIYGVGNHPVANLLSTLRKRLAPGGRLIVAIENQLGLKYLAGAPEDHTGVAMLGIQDLYRRDGVVTLGRHELDDLLRSNGFADVQFLLPFPDYKLPRTVISPAGERPGATGFDAAALVRSVLSLDPQLPASTTFSIEQAASVLFRNGLLGPLANSHLAVAQVTVEQPALPASARGVLAWHYSVDRLAAFWKEARFVDRAGRVAIEHRRLTASQLPAEGRIAWALNSDPYLEGENWRNRLVSVLANADWRRDDVVEWARVWYAALLERANFQRDPAVKCAAETEVPGKLLDAVPANLVVGADGRADFFDLEWLCRDPLMLGHVVVRGLLSTFLSIRTVARPSDTALLSIGKLLAATARSLCPDLDRAKIERILQDEAVLTADIAGRRTKQWRLAELDARVWGEFIQTRDLLPARTRLAELQSLLANRDAYIRSLEDYKTAIETSLRDHSTALRGHEAHTTALGAADMAIRQHAANLEALVANRDSYIRELESYKARVDASLLDHSQAIKNLTEARDAKIADLEALVANRDAYIRDLEAYKARTDGALMEHSEAVQNLAGARDAKVADLEALVANRDAYIRELEAHKAGLETSLKQHSEAVRNLSAAHNIKIADLEALVANRDAYIQTLEGYKGRVDTALIEHSDALKSLSDAHVRRIGDLESLVTNRDAYIRDLEAYKAQLENALAEHADAIRYYERLTNPLAPADPPPQKPA